MLKGLKNSPFLRSQVKVKSYDWLFRQSGIRAAACVFTDFDRLRHFELLMAGQLYQQLQQGGIRVLNDPARSCQREQLLHRLHQAGLNRFRAYPATQDPRPAQFPVFLKCVSHHDQDFNDLIYDQESLDKRLEEVQASGFPLQYILVIEFANQPHRENVYRRSTLYRIGDRLVAGNPVTEGSPFVKYGDLKVITDADRAASVQEMADNPYADYMRTVFEIAEIDYGRVDFGFDDGRPAVYEINMNPTIGKYIKNETCDFNRAINQSQKTLMQAVDALDGEDHSVTLSYKQRYSKRLNFRWSPGLKQP